MFSLIIFDKLLAKRRTAMIVVAAALGLSVLMTGAGQPFDRLMREARDGIRAHPASGQVHIVEIDAQSLKRINRWPWPRSVHAKAVDRLEMAGVRSIAFDVDFSATSNPQEDAKFARALDRASGSVILPTFRQQAGSGKLTNIDSVPAQPFVDKAFLAAVTVVPDSDGYIRQMPLGVETLDVPRPSLASMVAETEAAIDRFFEIDYAIDPQTIPRHSFVELINGEIPDRHLEGKRVIIGATAIEMGDRYVVPGHGAIPGVVVQALAAETLLQGPVPQQWGPFLPFTLAMLFIALRARGGRRRRRIIAFAVGTAFIFVVPIFTESMFAISFHIAPAAVALAAAAAVAGASFLGEHYRRRALIDSATGLSNLAGLAVTAAIEPPAMIIVARIDRFTEISAGLGSDLTAKLVSRVADRLSIANQGRPIFRTEDASLAWIERPDDEDTMEHRFEIIGAVMRAPVDCGRLVDVSLNLGMAGNCGADPKQLVANAALAALNAARKGVRWERFTGADSDEANWHLALLVELEAAMASGQVWNAYQPKLDIESGRIIGAEALVRWQHPERGPIAPDNFIPLLEQHGRVRDLTFHVLDRALQDAAEWDYQGTPIGVAVNVSAKLLSDGDFIDQVRERLQNSGLPAERLTIEVTESAAMNNPEKAIAALESWRKLGVNISIDDYGTGQSSLNYLQMLPATELKIDKSFVMGINSDSRNAIMVRSTIALAHELGMKVVAEGIEDGACLATLGEMKCDTAQGYFIGRPMSAENLSVFLGGGEREAA